jgi:CheY-like chemotaxis protein
LGQLAGGIAHDFNNQLAGIAGFAQLLSLKDPSSPHVAEHTRDILKASDRAASLTRQLLAFAREDARWAEDVDVNDLVSEVVELVRRSIDPRIEVVFEPGDDEMVTQVDPAQAHSAVLNLCLNARDAMPEGGTLTIRTRRSTVQPPEAELNETRPGQYALIEVADTGVGMSQAVLEHVFEPFFTTKARGTGMGLATAYGTARGHGGFVHVESKLGHGSTFRILLPLESAPKSSSRDVPQRIDGKLGLRVLVADDEPLVAATTQAMLEELGCTVHTCGDGQEAVDAFRRAPDAFDVVLLDLSMPRLSGTEALREIRRIDPNIHVVMMSGFTAETSIESLRAAGAAEFVAKPYAIATLRNALTPSTRG